MEKFRVENWEDYWKIFDDLINSLKTNNQEYILSEFQDSKTYVNGLTDGWYEFFNAFTESVEKHCDNLTDEQKRILDFLISTLKTSLKR